MKVGLLMLLALLAGTLGAQLLLADNGYVLINFRGYLVETSVPVVTLLLLLAYGGVRLLVQVWRTPHRLGEAWARRGINQAGRQATRGYIALAEGRLARGERLLTEGARQLETPLLNYLAAAQAAQMQGDRERRDHWLNMAREREPAARDAVLLTQAELQLADSQWEEALISLNQVRDRHPGHAQALGLLGKLHARRQDWARLADLLPLLRRRGSVPGSLLNEWSVSAYRHLLGEAGTDRGALDKVWDEIPRNLGQEPRLTLARARALIHCGALEDAEVALRRTLKEDWSGPLVSLYGELALREPAAQLKRIETWLKERPKDPELLLAAGRTCLRHELWGKARSYVEASLIVRPSPEAYQVLGQLMARAGDTPSALQAYEQCLALTPPREDFQG